MPGLPALLGDRPRPVHGCVQSHPTSGAPQQPRRSCQSPGCHRPSGGLNPTDPLSFYQPEDSFLKTQTLTLGLKTL